MSCNAPATFGQPRLPRHMADSFNGTERLDEIRLGLGELGYHLAVEPDYARPPLSRWTATARAADGATTVSLSAAAPLAAAERLLTQIRNA